MLPHHMGDVGGYVPCSQTLLEFPANVHDIFHVTVITEKAAISLDYADHLRGRQPFHTLVSIKAVPKGED